MTVDKEIENRETENNETQNNETKNQKTRQKNRIGKSLSIMGLIFRKSLYKIMILAIAASGMLWLWPANLSLIVMVLGTLAAIILPFETGGRKSMVTIKRLGFDREDLIVLFTITAFLELHLAIMLLKLGLILKLCIQYGYDSITSSPLILVKLNQAGLLASLYPYDNYLVGIIENLALFLLAYLVAKVVNRGK